MGNIDANNLKAGMMVTFSCCMEFADFSRGGGLYFKLPKEDHFGADVQEVYFHKPDMVKVISVLPTPLECDDMVWFDGEEQRVISCNETHAWITSDADGGKIVPITHVMRVTNIPILADAA